MIYLTKEGKAFENRTLDADGFTGLVPVTIQPLDKAPAIHWTQAPIPLSIWRQITCFFEESFKITNSETQVRLFYNYDTRAWTAHAFPQTYGGGVSTKELPAEGASFKSQLESILTQGYVERGTVHNHCRLSAFQSGTDSHGERSNTGIHITVGRIGSEQYDLHSRVTVIVPGDHDGKGGNVTPAQSVFYPAVLTEWFDVNEIGFESHLDWVSDGTRNTLLEEYLSLPFDNERGEVEVPAVWFQNLIKQQMPVPQQSLAHFEHKEKGWPYTLSDSDYTASDLEPVVVYVKGLMDETGYSLAHMDGIMNCDESILGHEEAIVHYEITDRLRSVNKRCVWQDVMELIS